MSERELIHVRIDRAKWWRGNGDVGSYLWLDYEDCGCCLGHIGLALGADIDDLRGQGVPQDVPEACRWHGLVAGPTQYRLYQPTWVCGEMVGINDDPDLSDSDRESKLIALAREAGYALEFFGTGNPAKEASNA